MISYLVELSNDRMRLGNTLCVMARICEPLPRLAESLATPRGAKQASILVNLAALQWRLYITGAMNGVSMNNIAALQP